MARVQSGREQAEEETKNVLRDGEDATRHITELKDRVRVLPCSLIHPFVWLG
jgi:hypothetical protein